MTNTEARQIDESQIVIWWLSQKDCEDIAENFLRLEPDADDYTWLVPLPEYLKRQFVSRLGRAGRGRLWVPRDISLETIAWPEAHPIARWIEQVSAGGIVFWRKDLAAIAGLPGVVTTTTLDMVAAP